MVSVILPNYNRRDLAVRAAESVLNQTYRDLELIIVDDGSTDDSVNLLHQIVDNRVKIITLSENRGACYARNIGLKNASGDFIAFIDSDDEWKSNKLEVQINALVNKKYDVVASLYDYYPLSGGKIVKPNHAINSQLSIFQQLLRGNFITTGTILAKKECFLNIKFDVNLPRYQDWDIVLQLAKQFNVYFMNESTLIMNEQKKSITHSTSMEKKGKALEYIYQKYYKDFKKDIIAESQLLWSAGMYSLYTETPNYNYLQKSCAENSNIKRKAIYFCISHGGTKFIKHLYQKKH